MAVLGQIIHFKDDYELISTRNLNLESISEELNTDLRKGLTWLGCLFPWFGYGNS